MHPHRFPGGSGKPGPSAILLGIGLILAMFAILGHVMPALLCLLAIVLIDKAIQNYMSSSSQKAQYERFKPLIFSLLCFLFSGVSSIFRLAGIFFLVVFGFEFTKNKNQSLPPIPGLKKDQKKKGRTQMYTGSSTSSGSSGGYYANSSTSQNNSGFYANTSQSANPYASYNQEDIVQQAKNYMNGTAINPDGIHGFNQSSSSAYQKILNALQKDIHDIDQRQESVSAFLDDFFAGSTVSKSRYLQVLKNAHARLETNYDKARQAIQLFGKSEPTPERLEILNRYVQDSDEIMKKVERVIDELITVQQNDVISDGDVLDSLLDDLANTTSYYQRSPYKEDQKNENGPKIQMPG